MAIELPTRRVDPKGGSVVLPAESHGFDNPPRDGLLLTPKVVAEQLIRVM
jgi:hypothetical protein